MIHREPWQCPLGRPRKPRIETEEQWLAERAREDEEDRARAREAEREERLAQHGVQRFYRFDGVVSNRCLSSKKITRAEHFLMLESQGGACAICGGPPPLGRNLYIDHDHLTGKVRGLLCHSCNSGLGMFKDHPDLLKVAAAYLDSNKI